MVRGPDDKGNFDQFVKEVPRMPEEPMLSKALPVIADDDNARVVEDFESPEKLEQALKLFVELLHGPNV
ncbi:MAG: hypothetical protein L3K14_00195 [Thermoplasmata archaeon]|nr:hypothetical protein [Thermoplasmata archaeon]